MADSVVCAICGSRDNLSWCSRVRYCSKACQKGDWRTGHKAECAELKNTPRVGLSSYRQFLAERPETSVRLVTCGCPFSRRTRYMDASPADDFAGDIVSFVTEYMIAAIPPMLPLTVVFLGCGSAETELEVCRRLMQAGRILQRVILMDRGPRSAAYANMAGFTRPVVFCDSYSNLSATLDAMDYVYLLPMGVNNGMDLNDSSDVWEAFSYFVSCEKLRKSGRITSHYCNFLDNCHGMYDQRKYINATHALAVARYTWWQYAITLLEGSRAVLLGG